MKTAAEFPPCVLPDPSAVEGRTRSAYPAQFQLEPGTRIKRALGNALGLTNFGVNLTTLQPGGMSAHRHWHLVQDEFIYVLDGELTLVTDEGETRLLPGMAAGFKANVPNGHQLINKSDRPATYLEVGDRLPNDAGHYPDLDLHVRAEDGNWVYTNKAGVRY